MIHCLIRCGLSSLYPVDLSGSRVKVVQHILCFLVQHCDRQAKTGRMVQFNCIYCYYMAIPQEMRLLKPLSCSSEKLTDPVFVIVVVAAELIWLHMVLDYTIS